MDSASIFSIRIHTEPWAFELFWDDVLRDALLNLMTHGGDVSWLGWANQRKLCESVKLELEKCSSATIVRGVQQTDAEGAVAMLRVLCPEVAFEVVEDRVGAAAAKAARRPQRRPMSERTSGLLEPQAAQQSSRNQMEVQRDQLLLSALTPVLASTRANLQPDVLSVKYSGEDATDGSGGAGVTRAFLTQAGELMKDARLGILLPALNFHYSLNPVPGFIAPMEVHGVARNPERWNRFFGRLLGLAVVHECPLGFALLPSICRQLLGQEPRFEDLRWVPGMQNHHKVIKDCLVHCRQDLVPPDPFAKSIPVDQLEAVLEDISPEIPSDMQLVFHALLLLIEQGSLCASECNQGLRVAIHLLDKAKTNEQQMLILEAVHQLLLRCQDDLPEDLQALRAALPNTKTTQGRVRQLAEAVRQLIPSANEPCIGTLIFKQTSRPPKKKRGGGDKRAVHRYAREIKYRSNKPVPVSSDWLYQGKHYYALTSQGSECMFYELTVSGIISGRLRRFGVTDPFEGELWKEKNGERVLHGHLRLRLTSAESSDTCVSNFKTSADQPWGDDIVANRVSQRPIPSLLEWIVRPTDDEKLCGENLVRFAQATTKKVLTQNFPYLNAVVEEFRAVVPQATLERFSSKDDFEIPYTVNWQDIVKEKMGKDTDHTLWSVADKDGVTMDAFFVDPSVSQPWACDACTYENCGQRARCEMCNAPRASQTKYRNISGESFPLHFSFHGWKRIQELISGFQVNTDLWRKKTVYRGGAGKDDSTVKLWWDYVAACEKQGHEELSKLFQWCTGWASMPTTDWKFQICVLDEAAHVEPGKERLPTMILCMTDDISVSNKGVKTPTLNLPKYLDRLEVQLRDNWVPFDPMVPFVPGENFDCPHGQVVFENCETATIHGPNGPQTLQLVSAKKTLAQKMWWAVNGGQNMDAL